MSEPPVRFYWLRHTAGTGSWLSDRVGGPPGGDLAHLRRGINREPGSVPQMWPFYTRLASDGHLTRDLRAEHAALTLFAVHQQSVRRPIHREGVNLGSALAQLRRAEKFSVEALDRRFAAAATATSLAEVTTHLRGLITQLKSIDQGLDYTRLFRDLCDWQWPERASAVRRRWGAQYFTSHIAADKTTAAPSSQS